MVTAMLSTHKPWRAADGGELFGCIRVIDHDQSKRVAYERSKMGDRQNEPRRNRGPVNGLGLWSFMGKVKK